ncbi:tubulin-specific chaperone rbl2 [Lasallia pustulata]|uniref:Tubulin-specific chaperone A n=1 Tax=Lasallia pustulata TaxID=136370 RepID=A0A1W5CZG6_9LECA|nr:tubulin-specific chaperone rbl2 [Lasallia pustulata]
MPPPTPLSIATSAVLRLVKEESSYRHELLQQESRVEKLQSRERKGGDERDGDGDDGNAEWTLGQEKRALEETKAVFPSLRERITEAVGRLERELDAQKDGGEGGDVEEITRAKEAVAKARVSEREIA